MKKKINLIAVLLFISTLSFAHVGGHGNDQHHTMRTWKFQDNRQEIEGSYRIFKDSKLVIENALGEILAFPINKLSNRDQIYIQRKAAQIASVNDMSSHHNDQAYHQDASQNKFWWVITITGCLLFLFYLVNNKHIKTILKPCLGLVLVILGLMFTVACGSEDDMDLDLDETISGGTEALPYTLTFLQKSFSHFTNVNTETDDTYLHIESNGIPDHQMMVGITAWIDQFPTPNKYTLAENNAWSIPLNPEYSTDNADITTDMQRGAIAIAVNGIPIFNPYNASGLLSKDIGELDEYGGHSGRGDDYHYHVPPTHLATKTDGDPIAFLFDGFPLYGETEPDGLTVADLDEFSGHEDADGFYHYHSSEIAPYMPSKLKGVVTLDGNSPQTQIDPQAIGSSFRNQLYGISGGATNFEITNLVMNETANGYTLYHTKDGVDGKTAYSWDSNGEITFVFTDDVTETATTTETWQGDPAEIHADAYAGATFFIKSDAIANGELLEGFKCESKDSNIEKSIPLSWGGVPDGTTSLAITMHHYPNAEDANDADKDPNAYLLLWDIDPSVTSIVYGGADDGAWFMGSNKDGNAISYTSPCSPSAASHEYTITIYALSATPTSLPAVSSLTVDYGTLIDAIETVNILGTTTLTFNDVTQ
ncbi:MAG: phosphatidylethanolamine-binding protein (PEBP) family uncharacterized protein [Bacteroidia bacterium]|jgi:phosphatidylethanolamine-binding protein (PEBP) family uncharacterized protein